MRQRQPAIVILLFALTPQAFGGGKNVAVVNNSAGEGEGWCILLSDNGHACTLFPKEGPTMSLDSFDVVIDMSGVWTDPAGTLGDFMRAGKTVITAKKAPAALGIDSNPTVQAWIGASARDVGVMDLVTVASDPILGDIQPGTFITDCGAGVCLALCDTVGHPGAKVLAAFVDDRIGIMRNVWEGGVSVFITDNISPAGEDGREIILNAVRARELTIPTVGQWGLLVMGLAVAAGGSAIMMKRKRNGLETRGEGRPGYRERACETAPASDRHPSFCAHTASPWRRQERGHRRQLRCRGSRLV